MPSKTDSLSSARAPPNRPFVPTFLPCLIDSAAAPTGHAEISTSSRAFPLRRNHANRAQLRFSMLPPSPQPFIPFFRSTTPRRRRVENKDFAIASIMLEINRSYEIYIDTVEVIWQCISMYFTLLFNCLISMTCLKERFREGKTANNSGNYPNFSIRIIDGWW